MIATIGVPIELNPICHRAQTSPAQSALMKFKDPLRSEECHFVHILQIQGSPLPPPESLSFLYPHLHMINLLISSNQYIKQFSVFINRSRYSATALLYKSPIGSFLSKASRYMCTIVNSVLPCRNLFCHQISLS